MAWCRQATNHCLSQCWPRSLAPYVVIRRQWVNLNIANHLSHVVWICPGNGLVPIRQQTFNRTDDDKVKACHLVSSGHKNKQKSGWEMHWSKIGCMCINSYWKYVEYCNKKIHPICWLIFLWNSWWFWYSWPTILKYVDKIINIRIRRRVLDRWTVRCVLGEH